MKHECKITVLDTKCFEEEWLAKQNFHNGSEDAYTG